MCESRKSGQGRAGENLNYGGSVMIEEEGMGFSNGKKVDGLGDGLTKGGE